MLYEIIATLGPASQDEALWEELRLAGATAFRLNTSHISLSELERWLMRLARYFDRLGVPLPVVLDLQGSKWRVGQMLPVMLAAGERVELICAQTSDRRGVLPVPHSDFFEAGRVSSGEVALNDGRVLLAVEEISSERAAARVVQGGEVSARKGITYRASDFRAERLSEKDHAIVKNAQGLGFLRYAISYVRDAMEMAKYRVHFGREVHLTAKIERQSAVDDAESLANHADALWLCRGDLGAEVGLRNMAEQVHLFSRKLRRLQSPVLLAGQVLEHLTVSPAATRSELCHLYDALQAGYCGFVLSDECAVGKYPVEACRAAALFR
ncbi:MAG: hypothetical protein HPY45_06655 [Anaerolineae bacterium]|nr:hypothetical protein [Anaerolineae bacterium]